jgi:hypothetical protein
METEEGGSSAQLADVPGRRWAAGALVGVAVLLAVLALALSYLGRTVLRPAPFADRAVATLRDPAVRDDVADRLTEAITRSGGGDLVAVRPAVRAVAGAIVDSKAFAALFRRAVLGAHSAVVERSGGTILVTVADAGVLLQGVLERFAPDAARRIGAERVSTLLTVKPGSGVLDAVRIARRVYSVAWVLAVLAVLAALGAGLISPNRRRTGRQLGIGLLAGGLVLVALVTLGRAILEQAARPGTSAAAGATWESFLGGLRGQALWLAAAGAICAGAASGHLRSVGIETRLAQGWRLLTGAGATPQHRLVPAAGLIASGVVMILEPAAVLAIVVQAAGLFLLYKGVERLLRALVLGIARPAAKAAAWRTSASRLAPAAVIVAAVAGAFAVIATGGGDEAPAVTPLTCNGFVSLCSRPLNDVALAATHNSMASVTIPSWLFGQQDGTIKDQLNHGIRGLLIDTYNGVAVAGRVRTDLESLPKREVAVRELGAPAVDSALRIRSRLGSTATGKPEIFLCHGFCELGAVTLASALADLRSFLVSNPGEVVVVVNQDEGVPPADIERAFGEAGLLDLVYRGPRGPFPTLRAMIDSGQRLVVMAENDAGTVPWYHLAYEHALQETPFKFKTAAELTDASKLAASCRPNRGPATAPLFLLNHWVDTTPTPRPSLAAIVNARAALLKRAQSCRQIRHRLPNLVAVDFYRRGDVLGVVNALNGIAG